METKLTTKEISRHTHANMWGIFFGDVHILTFYEDLLSSNFWGLEACDGYEFLFDSMKSQPIVFDDEYTKPEDVISEVFTAISKFEMFFRYV